MREAYSNPSMRAPQRPVTVTYRRKDGVTRVRKQDAQAPRLGPTTRSEQRPSAVNRQRCSEPGRTGASAQLHGTVPDPAVPPDN